MISVRAERKHDETVKIKQMSKSTNRDNGEHLKRFNVKLQKY